MRVRFTADVKDPIFSVALHNPVGLALLTASSGLADEPTGNFKAGDVVTWKLSFDNILGPDRYTVTPWVMVDGGGLLALREKLASVVVTRSAPTGALIDIPFEQEFVRETRADPEQETIR